MTHCDGSVIVAAATDYNYDVLSIYGEEVETETKMEEKQTYVSGHTL